MKALNISFVFLLFYNPIVSGQDMTDKFKEQLQFFLAPSSESTSYLEKYEQLLSCIANKVQKKLSGDQFEEFRQLLDGYANESEKAIADMEELLKNGPPRPSEQLMFYLGSIQETVKSCEDSIGISVEF